MQHVDTDSSSRDELTRMAKENIAKVFFDHRCTVESVVEDWLEALHEDGYIDGWTGDEEKELRDMVWGEVEERIMLSYLSSDTLEYAKSLAEEDFHSTELTDEFFREILTYDNVDKADAILGIQRCSYCRGPKCDCWYVDDAMIYDGRVA